MKLKLNVLLQSGLKAYYDEPDSLSKNVNRRLLKDIRKLLSTTSLENEPLLQLVLVFYSETINKRRIKKLGNMVI